MVQFVKGAWDTGERRALAAFGDRVVWRSMGEGFTWDTQDLARDIAAAERGWAAAEAMMADPTFGMVILDELNIALRYGYPRDPCTPNATAVSPSIDYRPSRLRVRVGNVSGTELLLRGEPVDLLGRSKDNVARLELN